LLRFTADDADGEAHQVELTRGHEVGVLRHLAADERAAGLSTPLRHTLDDGVDHVGVEMTHRDVVEEEQRLRALHGDVVGTHRHEIDSDRVVLPGEAGDHRLRADTVGRRHEDRILQAVVTEGEEPAEPAEIAEDLGAEGGADVRLDALDRGLARLDVDAGRAVGERRVGAFGHRASAGALGASGAAAGDSSSSFASSSGTGTGYSPVRQAVQNDSAAAPVAAVSRSISR
jgi:hypothetical protein